MKTLHQTLAALALGLAATTAAAQTSVPRITPNTLRVEIPDNAELTTVSDGVATLLEKHNFNFAFFSLPYGRMLGGFDYKAHSGGTKPSFSGGAILVVKDNTLHLLTADGVLVKLPAEVKGAKPFADGVASLRFAKQGEKNQTLNYIDANLNPVLTDFADNWKGFGDLVPRPLCDGMRAVFDPEAKLWGYADATGKKVIAPQYKKAGDFGDGVAFVSTDGKKWGLIDKTGKSVLPETPDLGWGDPEPFNSGWARVKGKEAYIDKNGNFSPAFGTATSFWDGYAFIRNSDYHFASVDTRFVQGKVFEDLYDLPVFTKGVAVGKRDGGRTVLINTRGDILLENGEFQSLLGTDGTYVWLCMDKEENYGYNHDAYAVCDLSGEILYVFDTREAGMFKGRGLKDAPEPWEPEPIIDPIGGSPIRKIPPYDPRTGKILSSIVPGTDEIGQVLKPEKVTVTVVADPPQGGKIAGGGTFDIGATVPVGALPSDGWAFGGFTCSDKAYEKELNAGWKFNATHGGKIKVTAVFYEQGDITEKSLGSAYVGHAKAQLNEGDSEHHTWPKGMEFDVILDTDNQGVLCFKFDPVKRFGGTLVTSSGSKGKSKEEVVLDEMYSVFWAPYKIQGFGTEGGTKYIYLHGGLMMVGNLPSLDLRFLFMLLFANKDPAKNRTDDEGSYVLRSTMNDYRIAYEELPDGNIRLGRMQICYPGVGWIYTDEEDKMKWKFTSYVIAMSIQRDERYMPSRLVDGTLLRKQSGTFEIPRYPDRSWFSDDAHYNDCKTLMDGYYNGTIVPQEPKGWTSKDEAFKKMQLHVDSYSLKWAFH